MEWITITEAAEILDVHPDTLRKWEQKGLLKSRRTAGGHRRFCLADIRRLHGGHMKLSITERTILANQYRILEVSDHILEALGGEAYMDADSCAKLADIYERGFEGCYIEDMRIYPDKAVTSEELCQNVIDFLRMYDEIQKSSKRVTEAMLFRGFETNMDEISWYAFGEFYCCDEGRFKDLMVKGVFDKKRRPLGNQFPKGGMLEGPEKYKRMLLRWETIQEAKRGWKLSPNEIKAILEV